jgi:glycosyltransferase involved in cell wall biosynthesis
MAHHYIFHHLEKKGPFSITVKTFESFIVQLLDKGMEPCDLTIPTYQQGDDKFAITFDDAASSVLEHAFPVMEKYNVKGILFAPTAFVGTSNQFMSWHDLNFLQENGWVIGSHTVNHPRLSLKLYNEKEEDYKERIKYELNTSKKKLEERLKSTIHLFAYPYGEVNPLISSLVAECGYTAAYGVGHSSNIINSVFDISRQDITLHNSDVQSPEGISIIIPVHNRIEILEEAIERFKAQSYPTDKFEVIIVDDASDQDIASAVEKGGPQFTYHKLVSDKKFNAGLARHTGAKLAQFPVLQFLDADILVDEDFLWAVQWVHHNCPDSICLGYISGYNLVDQGYIHLLKDVKGKKSGSINIIPDRSREPALRNCIDNLQLLPEPWQLCYTGNFSIGKELFFKIGGFETKFSGWGLEDLEFGFRCHKAGINWVFSRFALGYHITDENEGSTRNPYKNSNPRREDFSSYLTNLKLFKELHPVPAVNEFYESSLTDIENILNGESTVGVEFGGFCSLNCSFHNKINKCSSGELSFEELRDRVLFALKTRASFLYLLGGEPCEHRHFLDFLTFAKGHGFDITSETNGMYFSDEDHNRKVFKSGLDRVVLKIMSFNPDTFVKMSGSSVQSYHSFKKGYENLKKENRISAVRLVVNKDNEAEMDVIMNELSWLPTDKIYVLKTQN